MEYESLFTIEILNNETGEIGLVPSVEIISQPKHIQLAEFESCLRMYEEELKNVDNQTKGTIIFENGKGSTVDIKSGEAELVIVVLRKYIKKLRESRI